MQSQAVPNPAQSEWWRLPRVISETGLSRSTIYRLMDRGDFPKNKSLRSTRARVWIANEVIEWKAGELVEENAGHSALGDLL